MRKLALLVALSGCEIAVQQVAPREPEAFEDCCYEYPDTEAIRECARELLPIVEPEWDCVTLTCFESSVHWEERICK